MSSEPWLELSYIARHSQSSAYTEESLKQCPLQVGAPSGIFPSQNSLPKFLVARKKKKLSNKELENLCRKGNLSGRVKNKQKKNKL